ncbi:tetratricopeptide repeat protein [Pseudonocardia lacus]|uniref:tetratricopeptide repeat protein n=1 Tax=Pseudonocardia lacus TaxID=2835865 RepID=UPI001BDBFFEF|nr:tetratricopeptide repeat protein [Pseudonocardia lacus]
MTDDPPRSLQDLVRARRRGGFVGRRDLLAAFGDNLDLGIDDPGRRFLVEVVGDAGVGKSTLLAEFVRVAREREQLTGLADESAPDVVSCLTALAEDLRGQGVRCRAFRRALSSYQQRQRELESDPNAPPRPSGLLAGVVGIGLKLAGEIPGAGIAVEALDPDAVAREADRFQAYLRRKLRSDAEVELMWTPERALTRAFLADLRGAAERAPVVLLFDAFEYTAAFLEGWLLDVLGGAHGDVPASTVVVIAGQRSLDAGRWADYLGGRVVVAVPRFTDEEARELLAGRGLRDEEVVRAVVDRSEGLPLLLTAYAQGRPEGVDDLGDPTDEVVNRFLRWEPDARRRAVALHAALPRTLDADVFAAATGQPERATEDFAVLRSRAFVKQRGDGVRYHGMARRAMLRHVRTTAPVEWRRRHLALAEHYAARCAGLGLPAVEAPRDRRWQLAAVEQAYHRACAEPGRAAGVLLEGLLGALVGRPELASSWARALTDAAADADLTDLAARATEVEALASSRTDDDLLELLTELAHSPALGADARALALAERGDLRRVRGETGPALVDLDRAVALAPANAAVLGRRGDLHRRARRHEAAVVDFDRALAITPDAPSLLASRGECKRALGRTAEALADLDKAVALSAGYSWALMRRAMVLRRLDRFDAAMADLDAAVEVAPSAAQVIGERGETHRLRGDPRAAVDDLTTAIALDPDYGWAYGSRGEAHHGLLRPAEALADLDRAIALNPDYAWAHGTRAQVHLRLGDTGAALTDLDRAVALNPGYVWGLATRAGVHRSLGRPDEALADAERALHLSPHHVAALVERALCRGAIGEVDRALADLDHCAEVDTASGRAHYRAALLLHGRGEAGAARERLRRALDAEGPVVVLPRDAWHDLNRCVFHAALGDADAAERWARAGAAATRRPAGLRDALDELDELHRSTGVAVDRAVAVLTSALESRG